MKLHIKNAKLLCPDGVFRPGELLISNGRIESAGDMLSRPDSTDITVINADGRYVTPGLIDGHCHVGIMEEGVGTPGDDANETSALCTPQMRAEDGVNPFDRGFDDALEAGVTAVVTGPGSANVIGGTFCALKTVPGTLEDKLIAAPVALKAALGENPKRMQKDRCATRMANIAALRAFLELTRCPEKAEGAAAPVAAAVAQGLPLKIHAHRADDILSAIRLCREYGVKYTVDHCTEGYKIADILAREKVNCMIGPTMITRMKVELAGLSTENGAILERHGLEVAITTDHPETPVSLLAASAGLAVRGGMSREAALRAVTVNPARMCSIKGIGTLEPGKDADVVIFNGHPLDICSRAVFVAVNGRVYINRL